jgi:hypothetical protein
LADLRQAASAELERRRFVAQEALNEMQQAAARAQIDVAEYAKRNLKWMRWSAIGAAVTALFTFLSSANGLKDITNVAARHMVRV